MFFYCSKIWRRVTCSWSWRLWTLLVSMIKSIKKTGACLCRTVDQNKFRSFYIFCGFHSIEVRRRNSTATEEAARYSVCSLIQAGFVRKDIQPPKTRSNIPMDRQTAAWWWLNGIFSKMEVSIWLTGRSQNGSVAKGWLATLCCWEAAVHTID